MSKSMNIAIMGLGYVGCVTAGCLAQRGHRVIGVDVQAEKVSLLNAGKSPIIEPGLEELLAANVANGQVVATLDAASAVSTSEIVIICVGTPSEVNGDLDLSYVERVCTDIGRVLKSKDSYTTIVVRSTMLPGNAQAKLIPLLEQMSGKLVGDGWGFCINPEFLREGTAIADFNSPPFTVIGEYDQKSGDQLVILYDDIAAPLFRVGLGVAEMIKYTSNAFHALKVTFANEIGNLCKAYGIDSHQVMDIFVQDTKLNLSSYYLKPGFAFGGSCLPKDLRALLYSARQKDIHLSVLESILPSNRLQIDNAFDLLQKQGNRSIGLIGLSFKANTDDLRESPTVDLAERLIGKGYELHIYDREVSLSRLRGSNHAFIDHAIPHIGSLMRASIAETVSAAESIVIAKNLTGQEYADLVGSLRPYHSVIDLVRLNGVGIPDFEGVYNGLCW